ncbi:MAG: hypothetical protein D6694_10755 [Gammaproteobacteria bacterium]|nr:MAG: hypothetical protein D6694_10755 [Gammaproteobacteria bacterium]
MTTTAVPIRHIQEEIVAQDLSALIRRIQEVIAQVQPSQLTSSEEALFAWNALEPCQKELEATLDRFDNLLTALVDRVREMETED